jgi:hypothetical protein
VRRSSVGSASACRFQFWREVFPKALAGAGHWTGTSVNGNALYCMIVIECMYQIKQNEWHDNTKSIEWIPYMRQETNFGIN